MNLPYINAVHSVSEKPNLNMFKMHSHDDYELYCFLKGSAKYYVEGSAYKLKPEDILIMKRAESHSLLIDKLIPYERIVINFNEEALVGDVASKIIGFINNRPLGRDNKYSLLKIKNKNIVKYLKEICNISDINEKQLYLTFVLNELRKSQPTQGDTDADNIQEIIQFINNSLFEDISLKIIAERFFMNESHINRKFKKHTGSTIWSYIVTKRLIYSKELLRNGEPPTKVYLKCGFNDYCSFYKAYKQKYGIPPREEK